MARVKTFANSGSLLPSDLNLIQDDYELAFSTWKTIAEGRGADNGSGTGTYLLHRDSNNGSDGSLQAAGGAGAQVHDVASYFNFDDFDAGTRAVKLRLRAQLAVNAVAPGNTYTFGLYPVTTFGGTSGNKSIVTVIGALVAGSNVAFATPGASAAQQSVSAEFTAPANGWYVLGLAVSAPAAANSWVAFLAQLQMRQV